MTEEKNENKLVKYAERNKPKAKNFPERKIEAHRNTFPLI